MTYSERLAKRLGTNLIDEDVNVEDTLNAIPRFFNNRGVRKVERKRQRNKKKTLRKNAKAITKALNNVNKAISDVRHAQYEGLQVTVSANLEQSRARIMDLFNYYLKEHPGKAMKKNDAEYIKREGRKGHFDNLIYYKHTYQEYDDEGNVKVKTVTKTVKQLKSLLKKQVISPDSLKEEEKEILSVWHRVSNVRYEDSMADEEFEARQEMLEDLRDEEEERYQRFKEQFQERNRIVREVGFGGNSQLINALAYTYGAKPSGQKFVEWVQGIMKDPQIWTLLEGAYRSNLNGLQDTIAGAVANEWYGRFKNMKSIIETLVATFKEVQPQALTDEAKELIDEELDDFEEY